jgi:N-glycosylase/DNA lyase
LSLVHERQLERIRAPHFDLALTLDSGQVFHWEPHGAGFTGTIGRQPIYVEQRGDDLLVPRGTADLVARYFALDHELQAICSSFPADPTMIAARDYCRGLRIIRQPIWECLASFITSSMKQVAHIRAMSRALRTRFGERVQLHNVELHAYPTPSRVARATEQQLRECGLGYRAVNLLRTAQQVHSGAADLESWRSLPDAELREQLCGLPGVGPKVANCVMLFAYERLRAFPIDVWLERVLRQQYFPRARKLTAPRLREFCDSYFGAHGGYAQQYLFHHARKTTPRRRATPARPRTAGASRSARG